MTIWWCLSHSAQGPNATVTTYDGREVEVPGVEQGECWLSIWGETDLSSPLCRMVEMDLVPHETSLTGVTIAEAKPTP